AEGVRYESKFWTMSNEVGSYDGTGQPASYLYFWSVDDNAGWQNFGGLNQYAAEFTPQSSSCRVVDPCPKDPMTGQGCPLPPGVADVYTGFLLIDNNGTRYKFPNHVIFKRVDNSLECGEYPSNNLLQGTSDSGNVELDIDPIPNTPGYHQPV